MTDAPGLDELASVLKEFGYVEPASHFHGALSGALCIAPASEIDPLALISEGPGESEPVDSESNHLLVRLRDETYADLRSDEMPFEPMLPDDAASLSERTAALAAWCSGFLFGISTQRKLDMRVLTPEARETVQDFTQSTHAEVDPGSDSESDEAAYAELVEYIRTGAQILFFELHPRQPAVDDDTTSAMR